VARLARLRAVCKGLQPFRPAAAGGSKCLKLLEVESGLFIFIRDGAVERRRTKSDHCLPRFHSAPFSADTRPAPSVRGLVCERTTMPSRKAVQVECLHYSPIHVYTWTRACMHLFRHVEEYALMHCPHAMLTHTFAVRLTLAFRLCSMHKHHSHGFV